MDRGSEVRALTEWIWLLRSLEGVVLVVGGLIAFASLRAYRRTHQPSLGYLGLGFVLVTVAAAAAGAIYELLTHDLLSAWIVSTLLDAAGFLLILYSIAAPTAPGPLLRSSGSPPVYRPTSDDGPEYHGSPPPPSP
ncbi:MAG: hypothetical protein L3K04_01810 [Thermoplasmata archaeon]|nr:hypothetical protein [Thermoplasmata archaeon]